MNKNKLKDILKKLDTLDRSIPIGEAQTYLDQLVSEESKNYGEYVRNNPTIKFLGDLNSKLEGFKHDFNLKPVLDTIQDMQDDIASTKVVVEREFETTKADSEKKLSDLTTLVNTVRDEFSNLSKENLARLLKKISTIQDELSFTSDESNKSGQSLKQILDGYEKQLGDLKGQVTSGDSDRVSLRSVLDLGFKDRDETTKKVTDSVTELRKDMNSRFASLGGGNANRRIDINSSVLSLKYTDINFKGSITKVDNNVTKQVDVTFTGGGGSGPTLEVNGVANVDQTLLNLVEGTNMNITDNGDGSVTFDATGGGGMSRSVNTVVVNTTGGTTAATDYVYIATGITFTLPTAVGNTNLYTVKNIGASSVLVATTGGQTIDGSANAPIYIDNQALDFISDGANYRIV